MVFALLFGNGLEYLAVLVITNRTRWAGRYWYWVRHSSWTSYVSELLADTMSEIQDALYPMPASTTLLSRVEDPAPDPTTQCELSLAVSHTSATSPIQLERSHVSISQPRYTPSLFPSRSRRDSALYLTSHFWHTGYFYPACLNRST